MRYGYDRVWIEGDVESVTHRNRGVNFLLRFAMADGDELLQCGSTSRAVVAQTQTFDSFAIVRVLIGGSLLTKPTRLAVNDLTVLWTVADTPPAIALSGTYVVGEYKRTLSSGRVILVKPHRRSKPCLGRTRTR